MRRNNTSFFKFSFFRAGLLATGLLLLTTTPAALAQMPGGQNGGNPGTPSGGMQPNGMQPNGMQPSGMPPEGIQQPQQNQQSMERNQTFGNLSRNIYVETQLSKLAQKHTSNADVKKFAQQVISDDHKLQGKVIVPATNDGQIFVPQVPSQTQQAEKQMKKLSGPQFDQIYLVQMDAYVKNDQQVAAQASSMTDSSDVAKVGMQEQNLANQRQEQIAKLSAEENFRIK
ncbi:MAG: DUF4142 domain-containing protein [Terriglobia bacterium]|nr:DUF4142 domain-containing protein [Terriglobia bacterium]